MSDQIHNIFKDVRETKLSDAERSIMRNELEFFIAENPPRAPFAIRAQDSISTFFENGVFAGFRMHPVATACALVLTLGIGTSYAAGGALPGDALYGIKTGVNESVRGSLAISKSAQAEWKTEVITRRLIEAETLAAEGRLTPLARAEIETQINKHANDFDAAIAGMEKAGAEPTKVAEAQSDLEASLIGHADVLSTLSIEIPESRPTLSKILAVVQARATLSQSARTNAEVAVASSQGDGVRVAALQKKDAANGALSTIRANTKKVAAAPPQPQTMSMRAMSTVPADESTTLSAEQALSVGEQKLEAGEYAEAFSTFQAVIRAARTAQVHIDAEQRLNTEIAADVSTTTAETATSASTTSTTTPEVQ